MNVSGKMAYCQFEPIYSEPMSVFALSFKSASKRSVRWNLAHVTSDPSKANSSILASSKRAKRALPSIKVTFSMSANLKSA